MNTPNKYKVYFLYNLIKMYQYINYKSLFFILVINYLKNINLCY